MNQENVLNTNQEVTKEQITIWKKQFNTDIFKLTVGDKIGYLKMPDRKILAAATAASVNNPLKFNEVILNNCFIGGDPIIKDNDSYFLSACAKINEIIQLKNAELEKL